ncbi:hypothetical protein F2Q70_00041725 [Brassica cretica]|uniref:Uncharacterized protein n=1 Tax=Brassica cretica TaxID=69181 RepID=A0A8S9RL34_BRACR|nr:hypothetical protein F2Q70_00041725 [Brassica cretica]KAF3573401.1 hypothetical protein F2Q69_00063406 [Brassica cretica]
MHLVVDSVTICRFEVTSLASEEVVLMKILQEKVVARLLELFTGQESTQLGDDQPVLNPWNGLPYP